MIHSKFFLLFFLPAFLFVLPALAESPLAPIRMDHPRDTMTTFIKSMNDYHKGIKRGDAQLQARILDAIRTLDLSGVTVLKQEKGRESAILLKEVIDRVIVINFSRVPDKKDESPWRLKDTEISIHRVETGPNKGRFQFTPETVSRAREFYEKVKTLPYKKGNRQGCRIYGTVAGKKSTPMGPEKSHRVSELAVGWNFCLYFHWSVHQVGDKTFYRVSETPYG